MAWLLALLRLLKGGEGQVAIGTADQASPGRPDADRIALLVWWLNVYDSADPRDEFGRPLSPRAKALLDPTATELLSDPSVAASSLLATIYPTRLRNGK